MLIRSRQDGVSGPIGGPGFFSLTVHRRLHPDTRERARSLQQGRSRDQLDPTLTAAAGHVATHRDPRGGSNRRKAGRQCSDYVSLRRGLALAP